jgi:hypothetical protein
MHVVNDSTLVLVGGIGHTDQVTLLTLEQGAVVQTSSWPLFPSLTTGKAVKHMLIRHASVVVHSDATKVVIVTSGGGINCFSFGSFFSPTVRIELDLATQSLSSAIVVKAPTNGKETQGISTKRSNNNNKPNIGNNKKKNKKKKKKKKNVPQGDAAVEEGEQQQQAKGKKKKVKVKTNQLGPFHAKRLLSAVYHAHAQQQKAARAQGPIEKAAESKTDAGFDTAQSMYVVMADKSTSTESTQEEQLRAIAAYGVTGLALVRGLTRTGVTIVLDAGFASGQLAAGVALVCKLSKTQPVARVVCLRKPQSENPDAAQTILLTYVDAWLEDVSQVEAEDTVVVSVA